ncbi:MAG: hypothetical protein ACP5KN_07525 [Armatimonadota bacterium]
MSPALRPALVALALMAAPAGLAQPNLVANPGLEVDADADGMPDGWSVASPADYPANWHVGGGEAEVGLSEIAHSGERSIVYSTPVPDFPAVERDRWWDFDAWDDRRAVAAGHWAVAFRTEDFPVKEYHVYRVRCRVRARDILRLHIKFIATYVYPHQEEPVERWIHPLLHNGQHETHATGSFDWQLWEGLVAVPEFVERGRIEFWIREWAAPTALWCDDMSVKEIRPFPYFKRRRDEL